MALREPPKEFRIFQRGWNYTTKGNALFDDLAAEMVMAEFRHRGVDGVIDLEHLSIDQESPNYDPDARGWYQLEVRNGELWAVNCKWTPDGERRLRQATQRYISPFFFLGEKSRRVVSVYNVAICASPATNDAPALVAAIAASVGGTDKTIAAINIGESQMDFKKMICSLLGLSEDTPDEEVMAAVKALQEPGDKDPPAETTSDDPKKEGEQYKDGDPEKKVEEALSSLPPMVQAVLRAKIGKAEAVDSRLRALEERTTRSEVEALLAANTAKFTKKQEGWLRKQSAEVVREFLAHADPIHQDPVKEPKREPGGKNGQPQTEEEISAIAATDADRAIAKATGEKVETVVEGRKRDLRKKLGLRVAQ